MGPMSLVCPLPYLAAVADLSLSLTVYLHGLFNKMIIRKISSCTHTYSKKFACDNYGTKT